MFYLRNLRVKLQERRNRLYKNGYRTYPSELEYFLQFLDCNPYTRSLLSALVASSSVDFDKWVEDHSGWGEFEFPTSEEGRAKVCYGITRKCNDGNWDKWLRTFSSENRYDDQLRDFTEAVVDPLVNFLHDQIDDAGNVLYLIERFKLRAEWFDRDELYNLYQDQTSIGESNLDRELRASLFQGGIDYPFSQPLSPSGKADVVALLESDDPLVLEVKVFDPERGRSKRQLQQGFHQVLRYADDYNQSVGYLVVFNCSGRQLVISSEESSEAEFPPRINYAGRTVFVISIDLCPDTISASKERPTSRQVVSFKDLVGT